MKVKEVSSLSLGLFLSALGITLVTKANLGAFPITALNMGVANLTGITFGTSCMLVEMIVLAINMKNKENIGITTIANSFIPGFLMDGLMLVIPMASGNFIALPMLLLGLFLFSLGQYFITRIGRGNGAMNGLMNVLMKKTGKSVFVIRTAMEVLFMILAFLLGGPIGLATIILSFGCGYVMNYIYKLMKFEPEKIQHKYISFKNNEKTKLYILELDKDEPRTKVNIKYYN